jgi:hypothetical protein
LSAAFFVSTVIASASEAIQCFYAPPLWIASSRSLSSGAHSRDPLAPRNDEVAGAPVTPNISISVIWF